MERVLTIPSHSRGVTLLEDLDHRHRNPASEDNGPAAALMACNLEDDVCFPTALKNIKLRCVVVARPKVQRQSTSGNY